MTHHSYISTPTPIPSYLSRARTGVIKLPHPAPHLPDCAFLPFSSRLGIRRSCRSFHGQVSYHARVWHASVSVVLTVSQDKGGYRVRRLESLP